jgi:hypothetical protein
MFLVENLFLLAEGILFFDHLLHRVIHRLELDFQVTFLGFALDFEVVVGLLDLLFLNLPFAHLCSVLMLFSLN